jgi:hypothetical protein
VNSERNTADEHIVGKLAEVNVDTEVTTEHPHHNNNHISITNNITIDKFINTDKDTAVALLMLLETQKNDKSEEVKDE